MKRSKTGSKSGFVSGEPHVSYLNSVWCTCKYSAWQIYTKLIQCGGVIVTQIKKHY